MTERQEEQAALNALYALDPHERQILRAEMRTDPRLRDLAGELEDATAQVALLLPAETPPDDVRANLLKTLRQRRKAQVTPFKVALRVVGSPWVAWAAAACFALLAWSGRSRYRQSLQESQSLSQSEARARGEASVAKGKIAALEQELATAKDGAGKLAAEVAELKQVNALSRMEAATLRSTVRRYEEGAGVIIWDGEKQEGKLRLEKMPPVPANRDYQLWVFDRKNPVPVSAGVIKIDARGAVSAIFKPVEPVGNAARFAISVEALGGVAKKSADGPVIFAAP